MNKGAYFSSDRIYRYLLYRVWDERKPYVLFVGLNPSTADENLNDPTIKRCMAFAGLWGYGGLYMANLFGFRATSPTALKLTEDPIGPDNDYCLFNHAETAGLVVAAWGNGGKHLNRGKEILARLPNPHYLHLTNEGQPQHPLYLGHGLRPIPYELPKEG